MESLEADDQHLVGLIDLHPLLGPGFPFALFAGVGVFTFKYLFLLECLQALDQGALFSFFFGRINILIIVTPIFFIFMVYLLGRSRNGYIVNVELFEEGELRWALHTLVGCLVPPCKNVVDGGMLNLAVTEECKGIDVLVIL